MYTQVWNKYLPIIHILMKRAVTGDQVLDMNVIDFERSGAARKSGYKFTILFCDGRTDNVISSLPLAKDLASTLQLDPRVKELLDRNDYEFRLNAKFQLAIRYIARTPLQDQTLPAHEEEAGVNAPDEE